VAQPRLFTHTPVPSHEGGCRHALAAGQSESVLQKVMPLVQAHSVNEEQSASSIGDSLH